MGAVFDPDHDPDGTYAGEVVRTLIAGLAPLVPAAGPAPAGPAPADPAPVAGPAPGDPAPGSATPDPDPAVARG